MTHYLPRIRRTYKLPGSGRQRKFEILMSAIRNSTTPLNPYIGRLGKNFSAKLHVGHPLMRTLAGTPCAGATRETALNVVSILKARLITTSGVRKRP